MPLPIIPIITGIISSFSGKKIPGFAQTVKEFATSKTNGVGAILVTFGLSLIVQDTGSFTGHFYTVLGALAWVLKDAIAKK